MAMTQRNSTQPEGALPTCVAAMGQGRWRLSVWVQPGAKATEPAGLYQDCLKLKLAAPPVDGKANSALLDYLAGRLGLRKNQVSLASGHASRKKTVHIEADLEPAWASALLSGSKNPQHPR